LGLYGVGGVEQGSVFEVLHFGFLHFDDDVATALNGAVDVEEGFSFLFGEGHLLDVPKGEVDDLVVWGV
jgi:hypothetical protein